MRKILLALLLCICILMGFIFDGCGNSGSLDRASFRGESAGGSQSPTPSPTPSPAPSPTPTPEVTAVAPQGIRIGEQLTISGSNFGSSRSSKDKDESYVSFQSTTGGSSTNATVYGSWSDTQIVCTVPSGLTEGQQYVIMVNRVIGSTVLSSSSSSTSQNTISSVSGIIYVGNTTGQTLISYDNAGTVNGDIAPGRTISNAALLNPLHLGIDPSRNIIYSSNLLSVACYRNASSANGDKAPDVSIGVNIPILTAGGIFVDSANDRLYVDDFLDDKIYRFDNASAATGVTPPSGTITLPFGSTPFGMTVDVTRDILFLAANPGPPNEIRVWDGAHTLNGVVAADRTITSAGMGTPDGLFYDKENNELWVADQTGQVIVFAGAHNANGSVAPARTILSASFLEPTDVVYDSLYDRLYVMDRSASAILVFNNARTLNGNVNPDRNISGAATTFMGPTGICIDFSR